MERGYRDVGRSSLMGDYEDYRGYSRQGASGYMDRDPPVRDSYLGSASSSYRSGRSNYTSGSGMDRDLVESILQQQALQRQLNLRESQLALANSLLQQQHQQDYLNKRHMDPRDRLSRDDFKRPRLMDPRSRQRSRSGGRDSITGGRGGRGSANQGRNQSSPRGRGRGSSDRPRSSRNSYDFEKSTSDDDDGKTRCKFCNVDFKDEDDRKKHLAGKEHKDRVEHLKNRSNKRHCNICDVELKVSFLQHQRMTFHKKRWIQVTKGCAWCKVTSFKNFTEVLEHRATEKHLKNQKMYDKRSKDSQHRDGKSRKEREPIKVELPPELQKFDSSVIIGQACVVAVTGWFCKVCNKFYNNETAAKETHCMSEPHFNNYKKFMYAKLKAMAEEERDAREKAEEEERKKKEAEEAEEQKEEGGAEKSTLEGGENEEGEEQEGGEKAENDGGGEEVEEEDAAGEREEVGMEEEEGEEEAVDDEILDEPVDTFVDDVDMAAAEENLDELPAVGEEDQSGAAAAEDEEEEENLEDASQEEEPQASEEAIEAEGGGEDEEETEDVKRVTRGSPMRGRGRGGNRARRGRRVVK